MALPEDPFRNPTGIIDRKRQIPIDGGAAGTHTLAEIAAGDSIISVHAQSTLADVQSITDLTSEFVNPVATDGEIDNTGGTDTTGDTLWVVFYDADWGEFVNADWIP